MSRYSLIFDTEGSSAGHTLCGVALDAIAVEYRHSRYNISRDQHIIVLRADGEQIAPSLMHWGFTPYWIHCANPVLQPLTIADAKVEQPYFRDAFHQRRCLIPASGFYAWQGWENGPAAPYYVQMRDRQPFLMAAIWDTCEGVDRVAMITTAANELVQPIHDRMPAIIPLAQADAWLRDAHPEQLLAPYPAAAMEIYQVGRKLFCTDYEAVDLIARVASDNHQARTATCG